jgi:hypothetical protein
MSSVLLGPADTYSIVEFALELEFGLCKFAIADQMEFTIAIGQPCEHNTDSNIYSARIILLKSKTTFVDNSYSVTAMYVIVHMSCDVMLYPVLATACI